MQQLNKLIDAPVDEQINPNQDKNTLRYRIVHTLELVQDAIAISLCIGLFCVMVLQLKEIFLSLITTLRFHEITADILFILILVELFRLLIIYLQEQRVSIGVSVEVTIVSVLREVIVKGLLEVEWKQVLATCAFLVALAEFGFPPHLKASIPNKKHHYVSKGVNKKGGLCPPFLYLFDLTK